MRKQWKAADFIFFGSKITAHGDCSHEIKTLTPWKKSYDKPRQHIKKQRHCFAEKRPSSQSYGFSGSHVWMWELDRKESCHLVAKSCPTLVTPRTAAHQAPLSMGIFQARILEWVAISYFRGSSQHRDWTCISCIGRRILYHWATWEAHPSCKATSNPTSYVCVISVENLCCRAVFLKL